MSFAPSKYGSAPVFGARRPTFIAKPLPRDGGAGSTGALAGLIGGLGLPILCLGCGSTIAILGLFATMIGAAAYMNAIQRQLRENLQGAGNMVELNILVLMCALLCSIYVLTKHRRGTAISS